MHAAAGMPVVCRSSCCARARPYWSEGDSPSRDDSLYIMMQHPWLVWCVVWLREQSRMCDVVAAVVSAVVPQCPVWIGASMAVHCCGQVKHWLQLFLVGLLLVSSPDQVFPFQAG